MQLVTVSKYVHIRTRNDYRDVNLQECSVLSRKLFPGL